MPTNTKIWDVPMETQAATNWCWAATAQAVSTFYKVQPRTYQCTIAGGVYGLELACCYNSAPCNHPEDLVLALQETGNYADFRDHTVLWSTIVNEILNKRVLCARIQWRGKNRYGHFVAIVGFSGNVNGPQTVYIQDPNDGLHIMTFEDFKANYPTTNRGKWTDTYLTEK